MSGRRPLRFAGREGIAGRGPLQGNPGVAYLGRGGAVRRHDAQVGVRLGEEDGHTVGGPDDECPDCDVVQSRFDLTAGEQITVDLGDRLEQLLPTLLLVVEASVPPIRRPSRALTRRPNSSAPCFSVRYRLPNTTSRTRTGTPRKEVIGGWFGGNPNESGCWARLERRSGRGSRISRPKMP
jgi:hypothetical protein